MAVDEIDDAPSILRLGTAFARARILHSAVEIGLFEALQDEPADVPTVCSVLGLHPRLTGDFLDALVVMGLLHKDGGRYRSSEVARKFLIPGGPDHLGGRITIGGQRHYRSWLFLTDALRDGRPKADLVPDAEAYQVLYQDPARARTFLSHMDASNAMVAAQLDGWVDWSGYRTFVDVGGARGHVAGLLTARHPHLHGTVFDFPPVRPYFEELMAGLGTRARVDFHPGDFFADPVPPADAFVVGHVLHDWSVDQRRSIIERIFGAARPGAMLVVYDPMLDELEPDLESLVTSLNVGLMTPGGSEYTVTECREWIEQAGFTFREARRLPVGTDTVLIADRPL